MIFRNALKYILSFILVLFVFYLIIRNTSIQELISQIRNLRPIYLFPAFIFYFSANMVRAFRFYFLTNKKIKKEKFLNIVFVQNFFNAFLPFRLGELSYIHLVNKTGEVGLGINVASLIISRIFDIISIAIIFSLSLFSLGSFGNHSNLFLIAGLTILILSALLICIIFWGEVFVNFLISRNPLNYFGKKTSQTITDILVAFSELKDRNKLAKIFLLSFLVWVLVFAFGIFIIKSTGFVIPIGSATFLYSFPLMISLTPLSLFAGLGSYEGSAILGFYMLGIEEKAIPISLAMHAEEVLFILALFAYGYLNLIFKFKNK